MIINLKKFLIFCVIFLIMGGWMFSGWPQIWQNPPIPPEVQKANADTTTLRPNAAGYYQQWETVVDTSHWGATSDQSDSTYIQTQTQNRIDIQHLEDPTFGDSDTVNSVTAYARIYAAGSAAPERIDFWERLGSTDRDQANGIAVTRNAFNQYNGTTQTTAPDGGGWTKQKVTDLEVGIQAATLGSTETLRVSEIWIVVDYIPAAANISVSVSDGVVTYGIMPENTSKSTLSGELNDMQTATNNGDVTENFNIKGMDATGGGCTWTLAASNGSDQYVHQFCNDTDLDCSSPPTNYTALTTSYQTLDTGIAVSGTVDFQLRLTTPNPSSCYGEQTVNVTIQAVQP
jgi:hypothetical protein